MPLNLFNLGKFMSVPVLWLELYNNHHRRYRKQNGLVREINLFDKGCEINYLLIENSVQEHAVLFNTIIRNC